MWCVVSCCACAASALRGCADCSSLMIVCDEVWNWQSNAADAYIDTVNIAHSNRVSALCVHHQGMRTYFFVLFSSLLLCLVDDLARF